MYIVGASGAETDTYLVHSSKAKMLSLTPLPLQHCYLRSMTLLLKSAGPYLSFHSNPGKESADNVHHTITYKPHGWTILPVSSRTWKYFCTGTSLFVTSSHVALHVSALLPTDVPQGFP
ncbi:unnamed protein product, partial [Ectocarpus sp. 8 AP-2014]